MKQKNFYRFTAVLYFTVILVVIFACTNFLSTNIGPETEGWVLYEEWEDIPQHNNIGRIQGFFGIFMMGLLFFYLAAIFFGKRKPEIKIANAPLVISLLGTMLVTVNSSFPLIYFALYTDFTTGKKVYGDMGLAVMILLIVGILIFSAAYIILETLNRTFILKRVFADGIIPKKKGVLKPSLFITFLSFFLGFVLCPILYALYFCYTFSANYGFEFPDTVHRIFGFFFVAGLFVTILLTNIFRKPLLKFTAATKRISEGNYKDKVDISTTDEFGDLSDTFNQMQKSLVEKDFMRDTFGKIVSPEIRDYILNNKVSLGGETKDVTVMFCDIRSFTSLSEKLKSEEVVQMLNIYFTAMEKCIASHHGIINKYIGDAVMAIFGVPVENENHALDAYLAGLEMRTTLGEVNKKFLELGFPEIKNGIGLHSGSVLAGNIGAENRLEYTVIGDTVNVASRIEGLCKEYKRDFLISETTASEIEKALATSNAATPADNAASTVSGQFGVGAGTTSYATANVIPPTFLCESAIRGKEEKIKLWTT